MSADLPPGQRPAWLPPPPGVPAGRPRAAPPPELLEPPAKRPPRQPLPPAPQGDLMALLPAPLVEEPPALPVRPAAAPLPEPEALKRAALQAQGEQRLDEAIEYYRRYLAAAPADHAAWSNLGAALRRRAHFAAAVVAQRRALELQPDDATYWSNLGNALKDCDRHEEALAAQRRALELNPRSAGACHNYGIAAREAGRFGEALQAFEQAIRLAPQQDNFRWDRAVALLHLERWEEGWIAYDWRYRLGELPPRPAEVPRWLGEPFAGRTLLLHPEQGFGDTLFATRFLPQVKALGGEVLLLAKPPLCRLLQGLPGVDRVLLLASPLEKLPPFDYVASMMDLPRVFLPRPETAPPMPRLQPPAEARARADAWLAPLAGRFTVGVVWSGSVTFKNNRRRSAGAERFLPLAEVPGVSLVSLQKGPREADLARAGGVAMLDLGRQLEDFAETAAAIERLDLVIMTDSSVAHLCGALGRPVWNLLNRVPYWLYGSGAEATPWYPTMRLFRQPADGDWDSVFAQVKQALAEAVALKQAGRWPPQPSAATATASSGAAPRLS